ncbi:MAG: GH92 family glycosyl hydrolase [Bacteroidota bacterium]
MRKLVYLLFIGLIAVSCNKTKELNRPADFVNPFIGTAGHGHTYPGAILPFGMVQLSPDTRKDSWDGCSGYHYSDSMIFGFSHTHLSGTGVGDYGDIRLMPWTGEIEALLNIYKNGELPYAVFSHEEEEAKAGSYEVEFENMDVEVELTVGERSGMHRYEFEDEDDKYVLIDLYEGATSDKILGLELNIENDHTISGLKRTQGWSKDQYVYFYAVFSTSFQDVKVLENGVIMEGDHFTSMEDLKCILSFSGDVGEEIMLKVGISAVDIAGAKRNLESDIPAWDFDGLKQKAYELWNNELGRIKVEGGTIEEKITFYTALYHSYLAPYLYSDVDGRYRGHDLGIHQADAHEMYTVFSLWDTFRALHPLFTITQQERTNDLISSMLDMYEKGGLLPVWELAANETWCMIGYHAIPVITDAYMKGIRGFDVELAYEAMKRSSMQDREGLGYYRQYGFIPAGMDGSSVSKTLEYAYDDWCIAVMAKELGYEDDYTEYIQRAQYYKNIYDAQTTFMRGRMNGAWVTPFDPTEVNFMLTEANTWQYTFFVPQDVKGMMSLHGGAEKFSGKLDEMFTASMDMSGRHQSDITGLIGQYAHGNEPSHHMAYLYNFAAQPWKTQELVRKIMAEQYSEKPDGLCGNEDCGQMSAWYVFSAMGFYPVTPGTDYYVTGSPLFDKVTIGLENGKACIIEARNNAAGNKYIQSATLNGEPLLQSYIFHRSIMDGGHFIFEMGPEPNMDWGVGDDNMPVTKIDEHLITPAPYLIADSRTFSSGMELGMGCIDEGAVIRFTTDGSDPGPESEIYKDPLAIDKNTTVKAYAEAEGMLPSKVIGGFYSLMPEGRQLQYNTNYDSQYTAGGEIALIDLIRGTDNFQTGSWQGFHGVDVDVVLDLGQDVKVNTIKAGFLQDQKSWIFMPEWVEFSVSADGESYDVIGKELCKINPEADGGLTHDFSVVTKAVNARYIKVVGKNRGDCPDWHPGAGNPSWLFIDEIVIE